MRADRLAHELLQAITETRRMGTRIEVVENFCDGILNVDGPLHLIDIARRVLTRLDVEESDGEAITSR